MTNCYSIQEIKETFEYDPETGVVYRLKNNRGGPCSPKPVGTRYAHGYLMVRSVGRAYPLHRIAWVLHYGEWPDQNIDHINGIRDDNRIVNLRDVSQSDNCKNMRLFCHNKTGVSGVFWATSKRKWAAQITHRRKIMHLGVYSSFEEAVAVRRAAEVTWGYHENHGVLIRPQYPSS